MSARGSGGKGVQGWGVGEGVGGQGTFQPPYHVLHCMPHGASPERDFAQSVRDPLTVMHMEWRDPWDAKHCAFCVKPRLAPPHKGEFDLDRALRSGRLSLILPPRQLFPPFSGSFATRGVV